MVSRHGLSIGLSIALLAAPAFAQAPDPKPRHVPGHVQGIVTSAGQSGAGQAHDGGAGDTGPAARRCQPDAGAAARRWQPDAGTIGRRRAAHAGRGAGGDVLQPARAAGRACQAAGHGRECARGTGRVAADGDSLRKRRLRRRQGCHSQWRGGLLKNRTQRDIGIAQATLTQPVYTGGKTQANVNRAKNQVMSERATLLSQEQTSFGNAVNAYVGVIQAQQLLALNINNEQVLTKQLQATNDRFRVGEITKTDVAQAEASLAGATAQRQQSEGQLLTARGTYQQVIGYYPPGDLVEPQPLAVPVKTEQEATALAAHNNPTVITALFNDAAAKDAVDVAFAQLLPQVSIQGQMFEQSQSSAQFGEQSGYQIVASLSVPIYQGGAEYSAVRQAKQTAQQTNRLVDDARRTVVQTAVQSWETLVAAKAAAASLREQIRANQIALEGVEREAIVGSRTTLDVLNAQQTLFQSQTNLVNALSQLITASYQVAAAVGRLTARDLHLPVPLYDDTAYYNAVKDKWVGLGDYAKDQPGR